MASTAEQLLQAAILEYLDSKRPSVADPDSLDVAIQCIAEAFGVDAAARAGVRSGGPDLFSVYAAAVGSVTSRAGVVEKRSYGGIEETPLFKKFLENITAKKYFADFKEGSPEYEERFAKAVETFRRTAAGQKVVATSPVAAADGGTTATAAVPNDDIAAEALKSEGNTHLSKGRLQEAIDCYSAAIDKAPSGKSVHIYYANRAAAKTSAEDYAGAIADARQATMIDPSFAKAHARLGVALEFGGKLPEAVAAYEKALQLDPSMEATKSNLSKCKAKLSTLGASAAPRTSSAPTMPSGGGFPGGLPAGMEGLMNNPMLAGLMNNPALMQMAQNVMSNPGMMGNIMQMMGGGATPSRSHDVDDDEPEDSSIGNPAGMPDLSALMSNPAVAHLRSDPEVAAILEEARTGGPMSMMKHMSNPKIQELMKVALGNLKS